MKLQELPRNDSSQCLEGDTTAADNTSIPQLEPEENLSSEPYVHRTTSKKNLFCGILFLFFLGLFFVAFFIYFKCGWIGCRNDQSTFSRFSGESVDYEYEDWKYYNQEDCKGLEGINLTLCESDKYKYNCLRQIIKVDVSKVCNKQKGENKLYIPQFVYIPRCPGNCSTCPKGIVCRPITKGKRNKKRTISFKNKDHAENTEIVVEIHDKCSCQEKPKKEYKPYFKCL